MPPPDPARIWSLLGWRPGEVSFALPETTGTLDVRGMTLQRLRFAASHGESVPALFLPPRRDAAPAVLYLHAHGGTYSLSTAELTDGRAALAGPWLDDLAAMGAAVLCLEMPCFGSRADRAEGPLSKALLWHGRTLFGQMVAELAAGVDWLAAHPGIDAARIGCLGLSMGGTQAWWLAALERRIAAAVSLCAFSDLAELVRLGNHDRHGHYMTVPGLLAETSTGLLAGLAAPRPLFVGVGLRDWSSPPSAFAPARAELEAAYAAAGARNALEFHVESDAGHVETPAMRQAARSFLARHLGQARSGGR